MSSSRTETKLRAIPRPRIATRRAEAPADQNGLFEIFSEMLDRTIQHRASIIIEQTISQMEKKGWKPPTPSRAYIAEIYVREALGRRTGSPMASATFVSQYVKTGLLKRVPETVTENQKTKFVFWEDVEKLISEKRADTIRRYIIA